MMGQMAGSMGLPGMGPMSKKQRGRQMQAQSKKGKKGKGKAKGGPARRPVGAPGAAPGAGFPGGGMPGGMPQLPPGTGQNLPDLTKLNFDQFKDGGPASDAPTCTSPVCCCPRGSTRDVWVRDGPVHVRARPRRGDGQPRRLARCPGLVDAHCHVGIGRGGSHVEDIDGLRAQALAERAAGVLALRDCGSPVDTRALDDEPDLPRIIRAGRHIAAHPPLHPRPRRRGRARGPDRRGPRAGRARRRLGEARG